MEENNECINQTKDIAEDIDTMKDIAEDNVEHGQDWFTLIISY